MGFNLRTETLPRVKGGTRLSPWPPLGLKSQHPTSMSRSATCSMNGNPCTSTRPQGPAPGGTLAMSQGGTSLHEMNHVAASQGGM